MFDSENLHQAIGCDRSQHNSCDLPKSPGFFKAISGQEYRALTVISEILEGGIKGGSGKEREGRKKDVLQRRQFNMLAACNVEISFMRFGRGAPESRAR